MEKIIIIGGKGTAVNIAEHIVHARQAFASRQEFIGFAIDDESLGREINGFPILGKTRDIASQFKTPDVKVIYALYRPDVIKERVQILKNLNIDPARFTNFIHPLSYVAPSARLGTGNAILSNVSIQSNVHLGNFNIINSGVVIEHDTVLRDYNFIAASACLGAKLRIGDGIFVGLNTCIRELVNISDYSFIGMGSNLMSDVGADQIAFGNPAKVRK